MCQPVLVPCSTHNCLAITFVFLCFVCCVSVHMKCYFVFLSTASTPTTSKTVGVSSLPYTIGATTTSVTAPIRSSTQPTTNPSSDGATTTSVIIVVAVVIILVVIVVGVVILVVLFRAKKRKQRLVISKLHSVRTENQDIEMELKHESTSERERLVQVLTNHSIQ